MIALAYVGCEFVYNRQLLDIASGAPTKEQMDTIEWIGRVMAGFGCSMMVWRGIGQAQNDRRFSWGGFFLCTIFCVPIVWGLQEVLIRSIVSSASPQTLQSALTVMAGRSAMRPGSEHAYVGPEHLQSNSDRKKDEQIEQAENKAANAACASNFDWMNKATAPRDAQTLWALLGSLALNDSLMLESLQKKSMTFSRCRVKLMPLITSRQYGLYVKKTEKLKPLYTQYTTGSNQVLKQSKSIFATKQRTEAIWRSNVDSYFGFNTSITWGLSAKEFNSHPDVMRLVSKRSGTDAANIPLGLDLNGFRNNLSQGTDFSNAGVKAFMFGGRFFDAGEKAYKALLVPLIGLSLSLFFGLYNASLLLFSIIKETVGIKIPGLIAVFLIALAPLNMGRTPLVDTNEHKKMIVFAYDKSPTFGRILEWTARAESSFGF